MDVCCTARVPSRHQCRELCNALLIGLHNAPQPDEVISDIGVMPRMGAIVVVVGSGMGTMMGTMMGTRTRTY